MRTRRRGGNLLKRMTHRMTNMFTTKRATVPEHIPNTGPEGIPARWNLLRSVKKEDLAKQVDDLREQVAALTQESRKVDTKSESHVALSEKVREITEELSDLRKLKIKEQLAANVANDKTLFAQIELIKEWTKNDRDLIKRSAQGCIDRISTTTLAQEKALQKLDTSLQSNIFAVDTRLKKNIERLSDSIFQILEMIKNK
jgi:hypothetical protein